MLGNYLDKCDVCGKSYGDMNKNEVMVSRGYLWHKPCARVLDKNTIAFPSLGKIIPATILTPIENCG